MDALSLSLARDGLGRPLAPDSVARIEAFMATPSSQTWSDICGLIVVADGMVSIWEAVMAIDPSFPKTGRVFDGEGRLREDWKRIPSPQLVAAAIDYAAR